MVMKRSVKSLRRDIEPKKFGVAPLVRVTVRRSVVGSACYWHTHEEHEVIFLLEGAATYVFRNRKDIHLKGGQFLVIPAGLEHRMPDGLDTPSFRLGFNLSAETTKTVPFKREEWREILGALLTARLSPRPISAMAREHLIAIANFVAAQVDEEMVPTAVARLRLLCSLVVAECADAPGVGHARYGNADAPGVGHARYGNADAPGVGHARYGNAEAPGVGHARYGVDDIDAAVEFVERQAEGPFDLKALVDYMGYSRSRLFVLFRQKTGLSPAAYHQRQRLALAQKLLDTTDLTSEQVAERLGFESPAYFTYAFRRCFGITPIGFRRRKG